MTEDDTFNKLKKATFRDVLHRMSNMTMDEMRFGRWISILESMGWKSEDYLDRLKAITTEKEWNGPVGD